MVEPYQSFAPRWSCQRGVAESHRTNSRHRRCRIHDCQKVTYFIQNDTELRQYGGIPLIRLMEILEPQLCPSEALQHSRALHGCDSVVNGILLQMGSPGCLCSLNERKPFQSVPRGLFFPRCANDPLRTKNASFLERSWCVYVEFVAVRHQLVVVRN